MNRFTSLALMLLCTLGAMAATWDAPQLTPVTVEYGEPMYLFNVKAAQFVQYNAANAVILDNQGALITVTEAKDGAVYLQTDDRYLYIIDMENIGLTADEEQAHRTWNLMRQDAGTYRLCPDKNDEEYGAEYYEGFWTGWQNDGTTSILPLLFEDDFYGLDWAFVTPDAYAGFVVRNTLHMAMKEADELGLDVTEALNVYQDAAATDEQLEAATAAVKADILQYKIGHASLQNPVDLSSILRNASFDEDWAAGKTDITGWTQEPAGAFNLNADVLLVENNDQTSIGRWAFDDTGFSDARIYQSLTGAPIGKYELKILYHCIDQNPANPDTGKEAEDYSVEGNWLYAKTEMGLTQGILSSNARWAPAWCTIGFNVTDGNLEVGIEMKGSTANWFNTDGFQLIYYGQNAMKEELENSVSEARELLDNYRMYEGVAQALTAAADAADAVIANDVATTDDVAAATVALTAALTDAKANIQAYEQVEQVYNEAWEVIADLEAQGADTKELNDLKDYLNNDFGNVVDMLSDCPYTTAELNAIIEHFQLLSALAEHSLIEPGFDVTQYITNPSFDANLDGWTLEGSAEGLGLFDQLVETYDKPFTLSQTLLGMPNGVYTFTVQACQRTTWNAGWIDEQWVNDEAREAEIQKINMSAFLNAQSTRVQHIFEADPATFTQEEADGLWHTWWEPNTQMAVPAFAASARMFFDRNQYKVTLTGLVVDGTLTFGINSRATSDRLGWFDNVTLVFNGPDLDQAQEVLAADIAAAQALLEHKMQGDIRRAIEEAIAQAQGAADFDAVCAAIVALNRATAPAEASIAAYVKLANALENHAATAASQDIIETETGKQYAAYFNEVKAEFDSNYPAYDEAAIDAAINKLEELLSAARLEVKFKAGEDITRLLTNASFENQTGLGSGVGGVFNPPFGWHFLIDGKECTTAEEMAAAGLNSFFSPDKNVDCTDGEYGYCMQTGEFPDVYMYQTVSGLPTGTYEVTVDMVIPNDNDNYRLAGQRLLVNNVAQYYGHDYDYIMDKLEEYHPYEIERTFGGYDEVNATISPIGDKGPLSTLSVTVSIQEGEDLTLGIRTDGLWDATTKTFAVEGWNNFGWCKFDNVRLKCISFDYDAIENLGNSTANVQRTTTFSLDGKRISRAQRGVNIVRQQLTDGSVRTVKQVVK
ncbi:MAG: hypothetical protein IJS20_13120 [Bacteroidales bacterium]|nr:hypothetical protein [Bacteroidales bacterium]